MKNRLSTVLFVFITTFIVNAQTWQIVGSAGFTAAGIDHPSFVFSSNDEPYIAFKDGANNNKASVMMFDGSNWSLVGSAGFSSGFAGWTSLALNNNDEPFVAFRDASNSNKVTVMKYDGSNWITVGSPGFSGPTQQDNISIKFNSSNEPYVAFKEYNPENNIINKATVMKYDGTNWEMVGTAGITFASNISLAFNSSDEPYIAFRDGGNGNRASVMKFDGTAWVAVGTSGFSAAGSEYTSLAFNSNNEPFVAYRDAGNSDKVSVMKFDGTNWLTVGTAGFSAGIASHTSLSFNSNNEPYVAFREFVSGSIQNQATVMKFDGTNWVAVGAPGFSAGYADLTCLAINSIDEPYVAFVDLTQLYKATVMKYGNGEAGISNQFNVKNNISVYPNPTTNIAYVQSNDILSDATVSIKNSIGQEVKHYTHLSGNLLEINLEKEISGIYFIEVKTMNSTQVIKLIKD